MPSNKPIATFVFSNLAFMPKREVRTHWPSIGGMVVFDTLPESPTNLRITQLCEDICALIKTSYVGDGCG